MHPVKALGAGAAVGLVAGLVGAGGGFLIVPALILFGGVPMLRAVGTSLFVITLQSFAGFVGYLGSVSLDVRLAGLVTGAAVIGSIIGALLVGRVKPETLRRAFAWLVLAMSVYMLARQTTLAIAAVAGLAIVVGASCSSVAPSRLTSD